jgi:hypothetical protein
MVKITKTKLNRYDCCDLCLLLSMNGRGYVTKNNKKEFVKYIYDNQDNIIFYFEPFKTDDYDCHLYYYYDGLSKKKKLLNKEFLKEYYKNYFNMKIIYMTIISQE